MASADSDLKAQGDALYETYAKPLESKHWGEYIAVSQSGETVLGADETEVADKAFEKLCDGFFLFKVGPKAVWKVR